MLRSFRKTYAKLFSGNVFTTVRVVSPYARGRLSKVFGEDVIYLFGRTKRSTKLGRARVIGSIVMPFETFWRICTEDFARYDAETSKDELVRFLKKTIDAYSKRGVSAHGVQIFTYLWTERDPAWKSLKSSLVFDADRNDPVRLRRAKRLSDTYRAAKKKD